MCVTNKGRRAAEVAPTFLLPPQPHYMHGAEHRQRVAKSESRLCTVRIDSQGLTYAAVAVLVSSVGHGHWGRNWASTTVTDLRLDGQNSPSLAETKEAVAAHVAAAVVVLALALVRMPTPRPPAPAVVADADGRCCRC